MLAAVLAFSAQPGSVAPGAPRAAPATVATAPTAASAEPRHLTRLRELVRDAETTDYQHRPTIVRWKSADAPGTCRTDCSGLVNEILKDAYCLTRADLKAWFGRERPLAIHYQRTIEAGKHFEVITKLDLVEPGDLIAIKYPPDSDNSGHVMVVDARPEESSQAPPVVAGTTQWTVRIIDSSSLGHGPGDSRVDKAGKFHPGLGVGVCRIYVRQDGSIAGYAPSTDPKAKFHVVDERPLSIGRVKLAEIGAAASSKEDAKP